MAKVPHERTKAGRQFLALQRRIKKWIEKNRGKVGKDDIAVADWLQCEAYAAAHNMGYGKSLETIERLFELFLRGVDA